ncbi:MAG: tetratricopeptide repeat protein, partial [Phycisphaerae bacterium]|nr:tetratricopeptide repeat protein [Phycisphaerae bacterium]
MQNISNVRAATPLDQVDGSFSLPAPLAAAGGRAPMDALMLYAKARIEEENDQRYNAISLLEQAAARDPLSFDIQHDLAMLYLAANYNGDQAESALEKAAALRPDDMETQSDLGRVFLSRGELDKAVLHLRYATETSDYRAGADGAAIVDYYLAQALQKNGYDRAALESYSQLLKRLQNTPESVRGNPEIQYWLSRPELLYAEVGRLREKQGDTAAALAAYRIVSERSPDDIDTREHMVTLLMELNRQNEAARLAVDSIARTHASPQSLDMLRTVYHGDDGGAVVALNQLLDQHPSDRTVLFALSDMLVADGQPNRAVLVLNKVASTQKDDRGAGDIQIVSKLFQVLIGQNKTQDAARLLVETSAARPDTAEELLPCWIQLTSHTRPNQLHSAELEAMQFSPSATAAKAYWVARTAIGRPELLKSALAESLAQQPPFAPAYRFALSQILNSSDLTPNARQQQIDQLVASVRNSAPAIAQELLGIALLSSASDSAHNGDRASTTELAIAALKAFASAEKLGDASAALRSEQAEAELLKPDSAAYERIMWKLCSDRPDDDSAYTELFHYYEENNQTERAVAVSQSWLMADPNNVGAQLLHIALLNRAGAKDDAAKSITDLYEQHPDDPQVMDSM